MAMNFQSVVSSNIALVGYDPDLQLLEVAFKGGARYQYSDVPPNIHEGMLKTGSVGKFFTYVIKRGGYAFRKL